MGVAWEPSNKVMLFLPPLKNKVSLTSPLDFLFASILQTTEHRTMNTLRGSRVRTCYFLNDFRDRWVVSVTLRPSYSWRTFTSTRNFTPGGRQPSTQCTEGRTKAKSLPGMGKPVVQTAARLSQHCSWCISLHKCTNWLHAKRKFVTVPKHHSMNKWSKPSPTVDFDTTCNWLVRLTFRSHYPREKNFQGRKG
jgi:hypothetical protein